MKKLQKIPSHIAIIMDGNGRWATKRGLPRNYGHKEGINAIERIVLACLNFDIKYCSFFAFSTENWKRSSDEINGIFDLIREYLLKEDNIFLKNQIKVESIGVLDPFPKDLVDAFMDLKERTKNFNKLTVVFALNYGGRDDIVRAVNKFLNENKKDITEKEFLLALDTKDIPEPDIVLRTSGEMRISNFMLYQMAYSELFFPKIYWPDFNEKHLYKILKKYQKRNRRFGGIKWKLDCLHHWYLFLFLL
mgnify:CR=1 FL=1